MNSDLRFIRFEVKNDLRIVYYRADGSSAIYLGGSRNWRNNNPGNIAYGNGRLAKRLGAIGKAGGFAVFPSYEVGKEAFFEVLKQESFQERTLAKTIEVWASSEPVNQIQIYQKYVFKQTKIDLDRKIKSLSASELNDLFNTVKIKEGGNSGKIIEIPAPALKGKKEVTKVKKNKKCTIVGYFVEAYGWLTKEQALELASRGAIDVVIATSRTGNAFLRTRPDLEIINLEDLG